MYKKLLFALTVLTNQLFAQGVNSTFFKPTSTIPKIRFANNKYFTINTMYTRATAENSYNLHGDKSYLFYWHKPETMLNSFIDDTLPIDDTTSAGRAYIKGKASTNEFALCITKNIPKGFFFEIQTYQRQLVLKQVELVPLNDKFEPYDTVEIFESTNPAFAAYVEDFKTMHPLFQGKEKEHRMLNNTFLTAGFAKTWNHFSRIDFIDLTLRMGLALNFNTIEQNIILDLPLQKNNGFFAEVNSAIGVFNWLNIGTALAGKIYTSNQQAIGLNSNNVDNDFLKPHKKSASLKQHPFFYGNIYVEADHFAAGLSITAGYSYTKQQKTVITTNNKTVFNDVNNKLQDRFAGWSLGTMHIECEYDFATEKNRNAPIVKFAFVQPLHGRNTFKTAAKLFSCCLQFSQKF